MSLTPPGIEISRRHDVVDSTTYRPDGYQPVWSGEWQGTQYYRVHDAEHCCYDAHSDAQRNQRQ